MKLFGMKSGPFIATSGVPQRARSFLSFALLYFVNSAKSVLYQLLFYADDKIL